MKRMRKHLNYANVAATLALLFALSGGAFAATGGFSSGGRLSACVNHDGGIKLLKAGGHCGRGRTTVAWNIRGPAGPRGVAGASGAKGLAGASGAAGAAGKEGARGQSALQPLESGQTITGVGGARFQNGAVGKSPVGVVVSFPVRAPTPLSGARVELAPTANCAGSTAAPTAAPGFACIYEDVNVNVEKIEPGGPVTVPDPWGFMVDWTATKANEQSSLRFTWAYTAP